MPAPQHDWNVPLPSVFELSMAYDLTDAPALRHDLEQWRDILTNGSIEPGARHALMGLIADAERRLAVMEGRALPPIPTLSLPRARPTPRRPLHPRFRAFARALTVFPPVSRS
jgi:hypothetical protein